MGNISQNIYGIRLIRSLSDTEDIAKAMIKTGHFADEIGDEKIEIISETDDEKYVVTRQRPDGTAVATYYSEKMVQDVLKQYLFTHRKAVNAKIKGKSIDTL